MVSSFLFCFSLPIAPKNVLHPFSLDAFLLPLALLMQDSSFTFLDSICFRGQKNLAFGIEEG